MKDLQSLTSLQVAITSPDPELNTAARDYFTRHMRILEKCMESWPSPEMQMQVNQLREAFSADVNRPFELKRGFPFESPSPSSGGLQPSPPLDMSVQHPILSRHESVGHQNHVQYHATPITPPISSTGLSFEDSKDAAFISSSMQTMASSQQQSMPMQTTSMSIGQQWNPTPIIAYVLSALRLRLMLTEMIVSGTMHLDRQLPRRLQLIFLYRSIHHLSIPHQLPPKSRIRYTSRNSHILFRPACQHCLDIKQLHNYRHMLRQRLPSSRQACGETPSLARTTLQGISAVGIWKRMGHSTWTIQSKRSGQGRLAMWQLTTSALASKGHLYQKWDTRRSFIKCALI